MIEPGEVIVIDKDGIKTIQNKPKERNLCFELIYFARPDSKVDGKSIYLSRIEAEDNYREAPIDADIVIGAQIQEL